MFRDQVFNPQAAPPASRDRRKFVRHKVCPLMLRNISRPTRMIPRSRDSQLVSHLWLESYRLCGDQVLTTNDKSLAIQKAMCRFLLSVNMDAVSS